MHTIAFHNRENSWDNGLPLGNGVFGGMAWYRGGVLTAALNHYEIYYNISDRVLPADKLVGYKPSEDPGALHRYTRDRADRNATPSDDPFYYYRLDKNGKQSYATSGFSGSYPTTGNLEFTFAPCAKNSPFTSRIDLETATVTLEREGVTAAMRILREDCVVTEFRQTVPGTLRTVRMAYPPQRDRDLPPVSYRQVDGRTFLWEVTMPLGSSEKTFSFCGVVRLNGAEGRLEDDAVVLTSSGENIAVLCGVFTQYSLKDAAYATPAELGLAKTAEWERDLPALLKKHADYWREFFHRSVIHIPDKFLEKVYTVNQYALDCCSGRDGVMKHHACGLNGLWDVKHPNLWGSMWYWDVNIQAAFAGVFSSNRLDLGRVFSEGLLTYTRLAECYAHDAHGLPGVAGDYPYAFYYCVWPWCAQYLWSQYEYSRDLDYLRNDAYPLFLKLCRFFTALFEWDEKRGCYSVYPDISPEQGPLAHNSVITVASVKYLLKFTMEAAELLDDHDALLADVKKLYENLPAYPVGDGHLLDAEDAPANLWIRHPSTLMSIFPTGEINLDSDPYWVEVAKNTITYLENHCEIGVFQVSWLAACAARLGQGQKALRLLYEMGIDHLVRSNGLAAEENERFINYCLIMRQPLYYPCMMEFTGEMLAAVNEMLLQSDNGVIRLFPAMPDGDPEMQRLKDRGYSLHTFDDRITRYDAWKDCRFDRLLARGAFECSAELKDGGLRWATVLSKAGGPVRITSPFAMDGLKVFADGAEVPFACENNVFSFDTEKGSTYVIAPCAAFEIPAEPADGEDGEDVLFHTSYTKRKVFIGENDDTGYYRALDAFTRDWYLGNVRLENHTVYKFDFGPAFTEKDYARDIYRQCFGAESMMIHAMGYNRMKQPVFTVRQGYGFGHGGIAVFDRGEELDVLRRDGAAGTEDNTFLIDAPRGQYELLVISGDPARETFTTLAVDGGRTAEGKDVPAGAVRCEVLPLIHEEDGCITLRIGTKPGSRWAVNAILLNSVKRF